MPYWISHPSDPSEYILDILIIDKTGCPAISRDIPRVNVEGLRLKGSNYISTILKLRHTVSTVSLDMMDNQHF